MKCIGRAGAIEGGACHRLSRLARFGQPHIGVGCMSMNAILPGTVSFKALYGRGMRAYILTCVQWKWFEQSLHYRLQRDRQ